MDQNKHAHSDAVLELCSRSKPTPMLQKFQAFHEAHPEVFDTLLAEVRLLLEKGRRAVSIVSLIHYLRWSLILEKEAGEPYALNDHTAAVYSRVLVILFPEFNGLFEYRRESTNEALGVRLEAMKQPGFYARRLVWADGTTLEDGWRPSTPYMPKHAAQRRPPIHAQQREWVCVECGASNAA